MVSDDRLMRLFSEMVSWTNFAATEFALAEVEETRAEAALRFEEAQSFVKAPNSAKVTTTKAQISLLDGVAQARIRLTDAYAARKMHGVMFNNCDRVVSLISRELTRRVGREPTERRNMRWNP